MSSSPTTSPRTISSSRINASSSSRTTGGTEGTTSSPWSLRRRSTLKAGPMAWTLPLGLHFEKFATLWASLERGRCQGNSQSRFLHRLFGPALLSSWAPLDLSPEHPESLGTQRPPPSFQRPMQGLPQWSGPTRPHLPGKGLHSPLATGKKEGPPCERVSEMYSSFHFLASPIESGDLGQLTRGQHRISLNDLCV